MLVVVEVKGAPAREEDDVERLPVRVLVLWVVLILVLELVVMVVLVLVLVVVVTVLVLLVLLVSVLFTTHDSIDISFASALMACSLASSTW